MQGPARNLRMRGVGWRPLRGYRSLHGLGQDGIDGGGDGGGDVTGGFGDLIAGGGAGGGGFDTGGVSIDPTTIPGFTPPGSTDISVVEPAATSTPLPYQDISAGLPPGSTIDMSTGTIFGPGGAFTIFNDGSFMDGQGNFYDANGNLVVAATANAPSQVSPPSGGGAGASSGGGRSGGGGGSGSGQNQLQQLLCALNPRAAGCPGAGAATGLRPTSSITSSFGTWWNQYWPWVVGGGVAVIVGPMLLDALTDSGGGGGRRR